LEGEGEGEGKGDGKKEGGVGGTSPVLRYTLSDCQTAAQGIGVAPAMVEEFFTHYAAVNFVDGAGREITSLPHALAKWKSNQASRPEKQKKSVSIFNGR